jgi:hypothetical protein
MSTLEVKEIQNHISAILQERNGDGWKFNKIIVIFDIGVQLQSCDGRAAFTILNQYLVNQ